MEKVSDRERQRDRELLACKRRIEYSGVEWMSELFDNAPRPRPSKTSFNQRPLGLVWADRHPFISISLEPFLSFLYFCFPSHQNSTCLIVTRLVFLFLASTHLDIEMVTMSRFLSRLILLLILLTPPQCCLTSSLKYYDTHQSKTLDWERIHIHLLCGVCYI